MFFKGTSNEQQRCPRRGLIDSPELGELLQIRRRHGDALQALDVGSRFTDAALDAFDTIESGLAQRMDDEIAKAKTKGGEG